MNIRNSIIAAKQGFENSFSSGDFYNKQTQDEQHLQRILEFLPFKADLKILDLGTGSGYLSFPIAQKYPDISIIGLDIVEKALEANRIKAKKENIRNISFVTYNGLDFPFADNEFDMVISRYALHHFPDIQKSISEVSRVIKTVILSFIQKMNGNRYAESVDCNLKNLLIVQFDSQGKKILPMDLTIKAYLNHRKKNSHTIQGIRCMLFISLIFFIN